jgi:hypothetical protein
MLLVSRQISGDDLPDRFRALCIKLVERAVATIDEIGALEEFT